MTNWGSRMGFARLAEQSLRTLRGKSETDRLGPFDKILASSIGGALGTWNQPIEVVRVEMQSMAKQTSLNRPAKLTVLNTLAYVYKEGGIKALYRGVTPRIGLGIWQTVKTSLLSCVAHSDILISGLYGLFRRLRQNLGSQFSKPKKACLAFTVKNFREKPARSIETASIPQKSMLLYQYKLYIPSSKNEVYLTRLAL